MRSIALDLIQQSILKEQIVDRIGGKTELRKHHDYGFGLVAASGKPQSFGKIECRIPNLSAGNTAREPSEFMRVERKKIGHRIDPPELCTAMFDSMLPLPGLSPVSGKSVMAKFDGGLLLSDRGVQMLSEVEQRLRVADHLAGCIEDLRAPNQITHTLADIIRFRLLMIAAGYADGNDANGLRAEQSS